MQRSQSFIHQVRILSWLYLKTAHALHGKSQSFIHQVRILSAFGSRMPLGILSTCVAILYSSSQNSLQYLDEYFLDQVSQGVAILYSSSQNSLMPWGMCVSWPMESVAILYSSSQNSLSLSSVRTRKLSLSAQSRNPLFIKSEFSPRETKLSSQALGLCVAILYSSSQNSLDTVNLLTSITSSRSHRVAILYSSSQNSLG